MVHVHKVDTSSPKDVERFVRFPFRLYRGNPYWVPPLLSSARKQLNRNLHPYYRHSDADFFLATVGNEVVGRIAVLEPRKRNAYRGRKGAFFALFECVDDLEVSRALFDAAFDWARRRGLEEISGPEGFSAGDPLGVLIKGFEYLPALGITYNHPYYARLIEDAGFRKQTDYYSGHLPGSTVLPERIHRIAEKIKERRGYQVLRFRTKAEMRAIAPKVVEAYNAAFAENREFVPITGEDAQRIIDRFINLTHPELSQVVVKGDQVVGFILGFPNVNRALQRCRGRLYPFGWAMLMWEFRHTKWIDFNGGGILPQYQGLGVDAIMFTEIERTVHKYGFEHAEIVQVNEQNTKMMQEMEALGVDFYKIHRIYERPL